MFIQCVVVYGTNNVTSGVKRDTLTTKLCLSSNQQVYVLLFTWVWGHLL